MKQLKFVLVLFLMLTLTTLVGCGKTFVIQFESNGGTQIASVEVSKKDLVTKPTDPTKEGYNFGGWYKGEDEYDFSTPVVEEFTLVAKWDAKEYTVKFDSAGGSAVAEQKVKYNEKAQKPADPEKEGHTFSGWFVGETAYTFNEAVTADVTLTAKYDLKEFTVAFDTAGAGEVAQQVVKYNEKAKKPADPTKEGYNFVGWFNGETAYTFDEAVTANVTLTAKWEEIKKYTVKFMVDGEVFATQTIEEGKDAKAPTAPAKEGKTFVKWEGSFTNVTADVEIVAVYDVAKYSVDFKVDGQTIKSETVEYGKAATAPADPVKEGFKFVGWDKEFNEVKSYLSVTAKFEALEYSIKFYNGTTEINSFAVNKYTVEDTVTLPEFDLSGYHFFGWYKASDFSGEAITEIKAGTTGDIKLYALNVKADINGGSELWTTEIPSGFDASKGIDSISNLPEMFEMDFFKYLKDNNLLNDPDLDPTMVADTWEKFSGLNPTHNGDPVRIWNDTSTNSSKAVNGYVALFLYESIELNDDFTVKDVQGGFLGTEPYKTKYRGVLDHFSALYQYKVENSNYTALSASNGTSRALMGFVIDGYFYGTQGAADSYFKALRNVIPGMTFGYKMTETSCEKITYEAKGLPTPVKDGYVFAGWCLDKEGTKPIESNKPTNLCTIYAKWEKIQ